MSENFCLPSSRWIQSQTVRAERSVIPNSTEIFWRDQCHEYVSGCNAGDKHRRLLERWWWSRSVRYVDRLHKIHHIGRKTTGWTIDGPGRHWQESKRHPGLTSCGRRYGKYMSEASKRREKQKWAVEKPKFDNARTLRGIYFIDPADEEFKEIWKMCVENWKFRCQQQCLAEPDAKSTAFWDKLWDEIRMHRWRRRIYEKAYGRNSHCSERNQLIVPLQSCAQIYSSVSSNENAGCKSSGR